MAAAESTPDDLVRPSSRGVDFCVLAVIFALFLGLRVPLMYRQPGGMDEGDFSVPGCTILREGIPRIPYVPSRDPAGYFYRADEALFSLPPLYFYWQATFYALLSPSYGTARLASGAAAILAMVLIYLIGRRLTGSRAAALWGAGLFSVSRVCFFPAMSARPDMLCVTIGLAAIGAFLRWRDTARPGWLLVTSVLLGLGGLTHPFAIVYAVQIGVWALFCRERLFRRLQAFGLLVGGAILVFSLWLFLIVPRYEVFHAQFFNNVLARSGPTCLQRIVWPWDSIRWHTHLILEHAGPVQAVLMFLGLVAATILGIRNRDASIVKLLVLAWSSVYLLVVLEGIHSTKGYWGYPGAWLYLCLGWCVVQIGQEGRRICRRMNVSSRACRVLTAIGAACLLLSMLPGSGVRAWIAHVEHWDDPSYDAREFTKALLSKVPRDAHVVVDGAYVLPFYLDNRSVILAGSHDLRAPDDYVPYDYHVAAHDSLAKGFPESLGGRFVESLGERDNVFACYAELYASKHVAEP